jgi:hypothetical protein
MVCRLLGIINLLFVFFFYFCYKKKIVEKKRSCFIFNGRFFIKIVQKPEVFGHVLQELQDGYKV